MTFLKRMTNLLLFILITDQLPASAIIRKNILVNLLDITAFEFSDKYWNFLQTKTDTVFCVCFCMRRILFYTLQDLHCILRKWDLKCARVGNDKLNYWK